MASWISGDDGKIKEEAATEARIKYAIYSQLARHVVRHFQKASLTKDKTL